ncbi:MAG TPA: FUSC family protein, partial [Paraburkholderia sp.]
MRLDLVEPRTAMTTVFIVMQPLSGMVLAKSFYRMLGQIGGLSAMTVFIALFAQQPALYLPAIALWVGFCTAGAARSRNFEWYGFVLCGYTAALIGIPAGQQPDGAFYAATTRLAEVSIGVLCAGTISVLVFPQYAGEQLRRAVRQRYSAFAKFVASVLGGEVDRAGLGAVNARFVTDIVGLEASRSVAIFESPETRLRSGRVARLNNEFMSASTRLNMLYQLLERIDAHGQSEVRHKLEPYLREIAPLLDPIEKPVIDSRTAVHAAAALERFGEALPAWLAATRASFCERLMSSDAASLLLEFDTAAALLVRFVGDLREYAQTYASLSTTSHDREEGAARFVPKTSGLLALVSGIRASLVVMILSAFWIATAWPSGGTAVLAAAAIVARISSAPRPTLRSFQIAMGSAFAALAG